MTIEILGILVLIFLAFPLLIKGRNFENIERRRELQRSMKKLQGKYTP